MTSIYIAIALFALAAVFGLVILVKWLTKKDAPRGVVYSHGIVAAAGLLLIILFALKNPDHFPKLSLTLFIISAIAGFYMFFRDMAKKMSPIGLAVLHALVSACGLIALLVFAFS